MICVGELEKQGDLPPSGLKQKGCAKQKPQSIILFPKLGARPSVSAFSVTSARHWIKVEQPGFEQLPVWDAGIAGGSYFLSMPEKTQSRNSS